MIEVIFGQIWFLIRDAVAILFAVLRSPLNATSYQPGGFASPSSGVGVPRSLAVQFMKTGGTGYPPPSPPRKDLPRRFVLLLAVFIVLTLAVGITYVCLIIFLQSPNDSQKEAIGTFGHLLDSGITAILAIPLGKAAG